MTRAGTLTVELVRKLADYLDGIDVSTYQPGDVIELPRHDAQLLIAEGWALPFFEPAPSPPRSRAVPREVTPATDAAKRRTLTLDQLRRFREQLEAKRFEHHERRRAEDRVREEIQDGRARTIQGATPRHPKSRR